MSSYGSYVAYGGGRTGGSPYTSSVVDPYARNLSNHFEYIDADHGMLQEPHRHSVSRLHENPIEDPDAPDVILVRYMASVFPVEFPPYSISEETAYVSHLREAVARYLQTDPRRVRLVYKKRVLKHDGWPLRKYNMKQNSEVAVIKTEAVDYSDRDSHSSGGEDVPEQNPRRRPRGVSSVRHRSDENLPQQRPEQRPTASSSFLHPNGHLSSGTTSERQSRTNLRPEPDDRPLRREPSRTRGTSPHPSGTSTPVPTSLPAADPNTPLGKLQTLSDIYHEQWLPLCRKFISNPPSSAQDREREHRKLSESVMTHVILKADAIDVDSTDARGFRKGLLNEIQETMKKIDAVAKE
ncbi:uncharacterized protein Z520_03933 [Fonsecaea multimorphosa CBS 102226]|uniref:BAG domain-containing protein n=1 Tax=Fonsecaea multimorphosa CBS 102226 TaxID=1442371 RepID=A0A0D2K336_9EURO|nr:uncharacterized protein Z520_03933 [Fonsecaea multimorphosa CBS 102226]KIY00248.1 hypothetical protein Z520_03933 [Fonsecaea multimorphosa CBS 102226]OAL27084.1 hypothetical protein AYO22_03715 [Fonsecaea multimorphosa]